MMLNSRPQAAVRPAVVPPAATFQTLAPAETNLAEKVGVLCLNCFLFFLFSRLLDLLISHLPTEHIPMVLGCMTATAVVLTGGIWKTFSSKITYAVTVFTMWVLAGLPFSYWKGGSLNILLDTWAKAILTFFTIAGLINTYKRLRMAMLVLASALVVASLLLLFFGVYVGEEARLVLPIGELANSNQAALVMVLGLPLCLYIVGGEGRSKLTRLLFLGAMPLMLVVMLRTGSRAALIALAVMLVLLFINVSFKAKTQLVAGAFVAIIIGIAFMPHSLRVRYHTLVSDEMIFGDPEEMEVQLSAMRSTQSRRALLGEGIAVTIAHPIFGVGMGNFSAIEAERTRAAKHHADWSVTHNSYLQVSSETGIPGLMFYMAGMIFAWFQTRSIRKRARSHPEWADLAHLSLCLQLGLTALFILMFFGSIAYNFYFPCFAGVTVALERCARQVMQQNTAPAAVSPSPGFGRGVPAGARRATAFLPVRGQI
jgi:O-antigen ligase